jgi:hypothetical protein
MSRRTTVVAMAASAMQRMSSRLTPILKFVFPAVWISGWAFGTFQAFSWVFAFGGTLGTVFLLWYCARLRKVTLDGEDLIISDYRREVRVPLTRVSSVKRRIWISPPEIIVTFDSDTGLGEKVVFMPSYNLWNTQWWKRYGA